MMPEVRVYPDHESMSRAVAEGAVDLSNIALDSKDDLSIGLAGGQTPRRLYEILAGEFIDRLPWGKVHLYWCDERYVSQRHTDSNFRMFHEKLLYDVHVPLVNTHPMPTHRKRAADAALDYERFMRSVFSGEWPRIDLVLLGLGKDGHTASVYPGSPAVHTKDRWVLDVETPGEPRLRLTLTLPVLNAAAAVFFLASGEEKAETIRRILSEPPDADGCPASAVRPPDGRLVWWLDEAAFSRVDEARLRGFEISHHSGGG
jgi:6-phosphogluconolactonase